MLIDTFTTSTQIETSNEIERRFLGRHGKLQLTGESTRLTQMQLGSGEASVVLGEFLSLLQIPYYSRILRQYNNEICELLDMISPRNNIKMRVRKYGNNYGKITVKIRHGIQNGYKVYTEKDILITASITELLFSDVGLSITPVRKRRYSIVGPDGKSWDVDLYEEENSGLLTAEFEARSIQELFQKPRGIGMEITTGSWKPLLSTEGLQGNPLSKWKSQTRDRLVSLLS